MKKHSMITTVCYLAGIIAILSLILYFLKDYLPFFSDSADEEPEEDIFETPEDESADTTSLSREEKEEKEEKHSSQTKIRRGYIPVKFHTRESEEA